MKQKMDSKSEIKPTTSQYILVRNSIIHGKGIFAKKDIPKKTKIIEYIGEKVSKSEAEKRAAELEELAKSNPSLGTVYLFDLNKRYDIDGNVEYNTARLINHSCNPNCETINEDGQIWIYSTKEIKKGEELTYNYGYGWDDGWKDYPCKCGSENCVGYILDKKHWSKLKKYLDKKSL